ncbi:TPA: aspartate--ammonia ligase [Bacillus cereus]|nr:aspartate--ammonia ligase [Bacillus cereus]
MTQLLMSIQETQIAIKEIKTFFEEQFLQQLNLIPVAAPLFVTTNSGLNDRLGAERPIRFDMLQTGEQLEIVHSLSKWKRFVLHQYSYSEGEGLCTNMKAIRRDEITDETHSIYVDQWDWEQIIRKEQRTLDFLKETVRNIYGIFRGLEEFLYDRYSFIEKRLPKEIMFITSQELEDMYPDVSPKEREYRFVKKHRAVFIIGIGGNLHSGKPHDVRASDYDDWNLNGDIIFWHSGLQAPLEISSMGIRVDNESLIYQLAKKGELYKCKYNFHQMILKEELPLTIGGGIGQSRTCMYFLRKVHIGEVHSSIWPHDIQTECKQNKIELL